mmetsp:Transcript_10368/g.23315  ORF Transcript_10368/g.23315 Transcript_10368/m.23315 type:complete len:80 (-) Transcript_10368:190-429(-)
MARGMAMPAKPKAPSALHIHHNCKDKCHADVEVLAGILRCTRANFSVHCFTEARPAKWKLPKASTKAAAESEFVKEMKA